MTQTIQDMFYKLGGYTTESDKEPYISITDATGTYIPLGAARFNAMCQNAKTASVNTSSSTTGDVFDDRVIAELALYYADSSYDVLHIDPDTYQVENRHYTIAEKMVLDKYGVYDRKYGRVILPAYVDGTHAYSDLGVASLSY